jgi:hypothetical protein
MLPENRTLREGITAGVLGATAVAVWFLVLDTIAGRPFATPSMLGASLATLFGAPGTGPAMMHVLGYTLFHFAAFIVVGLIVAAVFNHAENEPSLLIGLMILFVAFEIGWYGFTALLARPESYGQLAWYQVMVGNLIAAVTIGIYMYRRHATLGRRFAASLAGEESY